MRVLWPAYGPHGPARSGRTARYRSGPARRPVRAHRRGRGSGTDRRRVADAAAPLPVPELHHRRGPRPGPARVHGVVAGTQRRVRAHRAAHHDHEAGQREQRDCGADGAAFAVPRIPGGSFFMRPSCGRGHRAGDCGSHGSAVGKQCPAIVKQHKPVAQQAPPLPGLAGHGPGRTAIRRQGIRAPRPMPTCLLSCLLRCSRWHLQVCHCSSYRSRSGPRCCRRR